MKRLAVFAFCSATLFFPLTLAKAAVKTPAPPIAALFYPNEVHLTVEEKLVPEDIPGKGRGMAIVLPRTADKTTFAVAVDGKRVSSFYWLESPESLMPKPLPAERVSTEKLLVAVGGAAEQEDKDSAERRALRTAVETLRGDLEAKEALLAATEARIALWQTPLPEKELTPDAMLKLDSAFSQHLATLYETKSKNARLLKNLHERLVKAEKALREYDAARARHVAVIPLEGFENKPTLVRYNYIMPGSCAPAYKLNAQPEKNTLVIEQETVLRQTSGQTWRDVELFISTARRDKNLRPFPLPAWIIRLSAKESPTPEAAYGGSSASLPAPRQASVFAKSVSLDSAANLAPQETEKGAFRLWSLGKRTVESDVSVTIPLAIDEHKARYYYTLHPSRSAKGFLTADISEEKSLELPQGTARFFVDDSLVGVQPLSINGNKATLFFGADPLVSAIMRDMKHTSGEKGFISKEQSVLWNWEILVKNGRGRPVEAVVLDPFPDVRDDAAKVTAESKPIPEQTVSSPQFGGIKAYKWKLALKPGDVQTITHKVQVIAPADKHLTPGRE